jgi:hypothetical protein
MSDIEVEFEAAPKVKKPDPYEENWEEGDCRQCHACKTKKRMFSIFLEFRKHKCGAGVQKKKISPSVNTNRKLTNDKSLLKEIEELKALQQLNQEAKQQNKKRKKNE